MAPAKPALEHVTSGGFSDRLRERQRALPREGGPRALPARRAGASRAGLDSPTSMMLCSFDDKGDERVMILRRCL
jgi:hypothetical protein